MVTRHHHPAIHTKPSCTKVNRSLSNGLFLSQVDILLPDTDMDKETGRGEPGPVVALQGEVPVASPHHVQADDVGAQVGLNPPHRPHPALHLELQEGELGVSHLELRCFLPERIEPVPGDDAGDPSGPVRRVTVETDLDVGLYDLPGLPLATTGKMLPRYQPHAQSGPGLEE